MKIFKDKVALITGGASGIGQALCEALAGYGARVVVVDVNAAGAQAVAAGIVARGGWAQAAIVDVSQREAVQTTIARIAAEQGRLDYLFNNAGIGISGEVCDLELEHWQRLLGVNLWGVIYGAQAAYAVMLKQGFGHIVNTASAAGLVPAPGLAPYVTAKHAVVGFSQALRMEAAGRGIKVSVVCPGLVRTGIFATIEMVKQNQAAMESALRLPMLAPAACARQILRGVAANRAIIVVTFSAQLLWWLYRCSPELWNWVFCRIAPGFLRQLRAA